MKGVHMKINKILSSTMCLFMLTSTFTKTSFAEEAKASSSLGIGVAAGDITNGYTVAVTVPTYTEEDVQKPYQVYDISYTTENTRLSPLITIPSPTGGTFSSPDCNTTGEPLTTSCSIKYTANADATVKEVETDLSAISYKGAGTITISVIKDTNTVYYNGHYYQLTSVAKAWQVAMTEMLTGDTESYKGYKGHPVTITSIDENKVVQTFQELNYECRIWIGGVTSTATKDNSYTNGVLNISPGGDGTVGTAGKGTGYKWIWGTPEGDAVNQDNNVLPDDSNTATDISDSTVSNVRSKYWASGEPNCKSDDKGFAIYMGLGQAPYWDDLTYSNLTESVVFNTAYYVTEYSPIDSVGNWLYDDNGESATTGFNNPQIVSKTVTSENIYKHNNFDTEWSYDGTKHWHKCLEENCDEIIDESEHSGGKATCTSKAKCETCNQEYGELDSNNHSNLVHVEKKDPTTSSVGNIEYWYCDGCGKYYSDEDTSKEITKESTIIAKLPVITKGDNASITVGDKKELSFTSDALYEDFKEVKLNDETLDKKYYTVASGSTVVTLKADYVATLKEGTYKLGVVSSNGTATATFTVNKKEVKPTATPTITPTSTPTVAPTASPSATPTSTPETKKSTAKTTSGWDDGGPFTTDKCGNVFDRWGNKIYEAKGCNIGGYNLVRTSVED